MDIEADVRRLSVSFVVQGALLLSLFQAHPDQAAAIEKFSEHAAMLNDVVWRRPDLPEAVSSEQEQAFREMIERLKNLAREPD